VDSAYPDNADLVIDENGMPVLRKQRAKGFSAMAEALVDGGQGADAGAVPAGHPVAQGVLGGVVAPVLPAVRQRAQAH
jgi:hypothetical protein